MHKILNVRVKIDKRKNIKHIRHKDIKKERKRKPNRCFLGFFFFIKEKSYTFAE